MDENATECEIPSQEKALEKNEPEEVSTWKKEKNVSMWFH